MIETQNQFEGGINTRLPANRIAQNQVVSASNVDFSHGDIRGEFGMVGGSNRDFYYESGNTWVAEAGAQGTTTIYDWPDNTGNTAWVADTNSIYSLTNTNTVLTTTAADVNFFTGTIPDGETLVIGNSNSSDFTVTIHDVTRGIHGANSYVEFNNDLYISRSQFTVTGTWSSGATTINVGADSYKIQVGDVLTAANLVTGVVVVDIDTAADTITLSENTTGTGSGATITVDPIISKYVDGDITTSFRVGAQSPIPTISFTQTAGITTNSARANSHSNGWFSTPILIPFQYALSFYDETGVESKVSEFSSLPFGTTNFSASYLNTPQYINITNVSKANATSTRNGRYALYRVGGTSAITKRCANLYLDTDLSVATTLQTTSSSNDTVRVTLTGTQSTHKYAVRWFSYNSHNYNYSTTNYSGAISGITDFKQGGPLTFDLVRNAGSSHELDIQVVMTIPGETVSREYVCRTLNHHGATVTDGGSGLNDTHDFIDWLTPAALADIQPIEDDKTPVRTLTSLIESNNLFFAIKNNRVHCSSYGNPNEWPQYGYLDFDQPVTGLGKLTGELVVFTEYGIYRVYGSDPLNLRKVEIPTVEGVPSGLEKCITRFAGGVMFVSHNGICYYDGANVNVVTQNLLDSFDPPSSTLANNSAGVYDNTYHLLGTSSTGTKLDFKTGAPRITNTTMSANQLYYRGKVNTLHGFDTVSSSVTLDYLNASSVASRQNYSIKTREFDGGDINAEKMFYSFSLSGVSFTGTAKLFVDGSATDTFTVSSTESDFNRSFYASSPRTGNAASVEITNGTGQIEKISITSDLKNALKKMLFASVNIVYTGTPTITVDVDGTNKISSTTLSAPTGNAGEATVYFPAMTTGIVPHFRETGDEANGRVVSFQYSASEV